MKQINEFFGVGGIRFSKRDQNYKYEVRSINDLVTKIIPHFQDYPLQTSKKDDFELFEDICQKIHSNHHRSVSGLREIIDKAYAMNPSGKRRYSKEELLKPLTR